MRIGAENAGGAPNLSVSRRLAMSKACNFSYALIVITGLSERLDDTQEPGVNLGQVPREEGLSAPRNTFSSRAAPAAINGSQLDFQFFAGQHLSDGKERGRAFEDMLRRLLFTRARNRNPDHYSALRTFPAVFGYWNKSRQEQLSEFVSFVLVQKFNQPVVLKSITFVSLKTFLYSLI